MLLSKLIKSIEINRIVNMQDIAITGIEHNSKKCSNNFLFVAIKGANVDGNDFIDNAISNGAAVIVTSSIQQSNLQTKNIVFIEVKDARIALAQLAHCFYNEPAKKLKIVGITGTNGKTTTTFLIKSILEEAQKKAAIIGTTGIFIDNEKIEATHTTPESLELAKLFNDIVQAGIEYVIMEVSSHSLALNRVFGIDFFIGVFTNLTHEHLDFHKNFDEYAKAKKMLFDNNLSEKSIAIVNGDAAYADFMLSDCKAKKKIISSNILTADYFIDNIQIQKHCSSFSVKLNFPTPQTFEINTQLTALFNIQNAAVAIAVGFELGINSDDIIRGIAKSEGASGRLEHIALKNGATAYVDYAHTPDALEQALISCKKLITDAENQGKLICVFGCGGDRDKSKRSLMGAIAEKYSGVVVITNDNPRTEKSENIINDILEGINDDAKIQVIPSRSEAIKYAVSISALADIILVAGKGHENYQIIGTEKHYFSDAEELNKCL